LKRGIDYDKALDAINTFRKELVNERVRSKNTKFPKERLAQEKASKYRHGVSEGIHFVFRPSSDDFKLLDEPVKEALKDWVKRIENGFEDSSVSTYEFLGTYDEFIQVASGLTTDVGCAMKPLCSYPDNNNDDDKIEKIEDFSEKKKIWEQRHIQYIVCKFWPKKSDVGNTPNAIHFVSSTINSVNSICLGNMLGVVIGNNISE
uniref:SCP domain-containing protein n=1 Tax=Dracunculus medinensis TaxID=318479 RepID=A0A0N4URI7_DRAME